ncbi:YpdA family putative bacillithiol disulfide reductase [Paenibacillus thailandensis]|uniref:YpdA family putative bacillithiol disulfide reductase n=1 Tax=Paenibacillus thailandensis TaxID=393250 RepID=A0ABW5QTG1_9BACL
MHKEVAIIIGAGPCGIAAAVELQRAGIVPLIIEKQNIAHSISMYPTYMHFFSSPENLEIGDIPFTTANEKPSRLEALNYYRTVALRHKLRVNAFETVTSVKQANGCFELTSVDRFGESKTYYSDNVIIATGYFDHPNYLGIPGEQLDKVTHFFREAHPYTGMNVAIIGGSNSAIDAALELERVGAKVTIVYRGDTYSSSIKPWVRPSIEGKVSKGLIDIRFGSRVVEIEPRTVTIEKADGTREKLANDFVLALTGFHPDRQFMIESGIRIEEEGFPHFDETTMETNVPGLFIAGVVASRYEANEIFIESGRFHGRKIAEYLKSKQQA